MWQSVGTLWVLGVGMVAVGIHFLLFDAYFPNAGGRLGHDYALILPSLLDGTYWYSIHGWSAVPWFTPAFCGGVPKFANPQALYYSLPQWFAFFVDPLAAIRVTTLVCSTVGFAATYGLLARVFLVSRETAALGAVLFLFNGFFLSRMMIGHVAFHAFMFFPLALLLLLRRESRVDRVGWLRAIAAVSQSSLILAYVAVNAFAYLLPPLIVVAVALAALCELVGANYRRRDFLAKLAAAGAVAALVSSAKIHAAVAYLAHFPRDLYPLPGVANVGDLLLIVTRALFFSPPVALGQSALANSQWSLGYHEWDYGVSFVPFLMLAFCAIYRLDALAAVRHLGRRRLGALLLLIVCLLLPLAINYYAPGWNALLKALPVFGSSSSLTRWFCFYIPVVVVTSALALEVCVPQGIRFRTIAWGAGISVVGISLVADRAHYDAQQYDPSAILSAHRAVTSGEWTPEISRLTTMRDSAGREVLSKGRNDSLARGESQLLCYEPIFGYRLERFPRGLLREGPIDLATEGQLNLKKPSCYVFPQENACEPGAHFSIDERDAAMTFARYGGHEFRMSTPQKFANVASLVGLGLSVVGSLLPAVALRLPLRRR